MNELACITQSKLGPFHVPNAIGIDVWDLPRGQHQIAPETVEASQRARMLYAVTAAAAERGYAHFTVADICRIAHVSRKTFYEQFSNREDCFLRAYETGVHTLIQTLRNAVQHHRRASGDWQMLIRAAVRAILVFLRTHPELTRILLIEIRGADHRVWAVRDQAHGRFACLLRALCMDSGAMTPLPRHRRALFPALISAAEGLLTPYAQHRQVQRIMHAEPELTRLLLTIWHSHAIEESAEESTERPTEISTERSTEQSAPPPCMAASPRFAVHA